MKRIALTCELSPDIMREFVAAFDLLDLPLRSSSLLDVRHELQDCDDKSVEKTRPTNGRGKRHANDQ